jgi:hypothetical protein
MDKAIKFYMANYSNIKAIFDLKLYVETRITKVIVELVHPALAKAIRDWTWSENARADISPLFWHDEYCLSWADHAWLNNNKAGFHFGAEGFDLEAIVSPTEANEPYLYLYQNRGVRVAGLTTRGLQSAIEEVRRPLRELGASLELQSGKSGVFFVKWSLRDVVNADRLIDEQKVAEEFCKRARQFTELLAPRIYAAGARGRHTT